MLTQPRYARHGKRTWRTHPYALGIIHACIRDTFETTLFDPNFDSLSDPEIIAALQRANPDVVGISTISTEYVQEIEYMTRLVREALHDDDAGLTEDLIVDKE